MKDSIKDKLEECYRHIEPYLHDQEILTDMCKRCENWMGSEHDYSECREKPCFICYLGYEYMAWCDSWEQFNMSRWIYDGYTKVKVGNGRHARMVENRIYICPDCKQSIRLEWMVKPPMYCPNCNANMKEEQ